VAENSLSILASYVPPAVVRAIYRRPIVPTEPTVQRFPAAVLFADVSGFTPLAEGLARFGPQGAEELTRLLNGYFSRMITLVEKEGGEVVKFSGDAMTVVFPAPSGVEYAARQAMNAAQAMQAAMSDFRTLQTIAGTVELGMKIGVGAGDVLAFSVGGEGGRWEYIIAGDPLRQVAEAEHAASRGEIVLSPEAQTLLGNHATPPPPRPPLDWERLSPEQQAATEAALRAYIPDIITSRLAAGQADWLAELRRLTVLFVSVVEGLDYNTPDVLEHLQAFTRTTQSIFLRYEGSINKIAVDDKGTILIGLFGAPPYAHEDDTERAVRCALDLQAAAIGQGLQLAIGVTSGQVFAGPVGSETRREYTVMGDTVNLSARLMSVAAAARQQNPADNAIRCDHETYRVAAAHLRFDTLPPVRVKGKADRVQVYRPLRLARRRIRRIEGRGKFVGREEELARLKELLAEVCAPPAAPAAEEMPALLQPTAERRRLVLIEGEAGIGKSRLVQEMRAFVRAEGILQLGGAGSSIEQNTPYRAWRDVFSLLFDLEELEITDIRQRQERVTTYIRTRAPHLQARTPLLNDILNLELPENELTRHLDPELRHESLISLLLDLLRLQTEQGPLVITLEDAHWLDAASWELVLEVARALANLPLLFIIALRPLRSEQATAEYTQIRNLPGSVFISLSGLDAADTTSLVAARLGVDALPKEVSELVQTRSGGNPFVAEQLAHALQENNVVTIEITNGTAQCVVSGDLERLALPDTVQGLVLSRLDRLPPEEYLTLKVASVIGRTFAYRLLRAIYPTQITDPLLQSYLDDLARLDLTPRQTAELMPGAPQAGGDIVHFFKHIITQEVAYETLLYSQRRQLHREVAAWYETSYGGPETDGESGASLLAPYFPLLVYHYHRAQEAEQERRYCRLAGKQAAAQFANNDAVRYLSRAIELLGVADLSQVAEALKTLPPARQQELFDLLAEREEVYDRLGKRDLQSADLEAMLVIAEAWQDDESRALVYNRMSRYYGYTGDYPAAASAAEIGRQAANAARKKRVEAESLKWLATISWKQGDYQKAVNYGEQALTLLENTDDQHSRAAIYRVLGLVHNDLGDPHKALEYQQKALVLEQATGDRYGEGSSSINLGNAFHALGDLLTARQHYRHALDIFRSIGYRRTMAYALGSLGLVSRDLGDYASARNQFAQTLSILHAIGDRWGEAIGLQNISLVYCARGQYSIARDHCERALAMQRELGDKRGEAFSLTYLGLALEGLEEWSEAEEAYRQALSLRREIGQEAMAMENVAGLARVALARNNLSAAQQHVAEIRRWLSESGIEGIEDPLRVYHTAYRVLEAAGQTDEARTLLAEAHSLLMQKAEKIDDPRWRKSFLHEPLHRDILNAWEANHVSP